MALEMLGNWRYGVWLLEEQEDGSFAAVVRSMGGGVMAGDEE